MGQILEALKNIVTFIGHLISFPVRILQLLIGFDIADIVANGFWWVPVTAGACIVSILALSVVLRIFSK